MCVGFQSQSVTCSASKVTSPFLGTGSHLGLVPVTWSPTAPVSCSCHLIPITCYSGSQHPICLSLAPSFTVFKSSLLLPSHSPSGGEASMNYQSNAGKSWESTDKLCLALPANPEQILGKNLGAVATSLPIQTQYTQPVKSRKCLSSRNRAELNCSILLFGSVIVELSPSMLY